MPAMIRLVASRRVGEAWMSGYEGSAYSRRGFLKSAAIGAAIATLPAGTRLAFGATGAPSSTIVVLLLRGGQDGLLLLAPADDSNYVAARPSTLRVTNSGTGAGIALAKGPTRQDWRLNPAAAPLAELYQQGTLGFVTAAGLDSDTRSHFQAIDLIETGLTDVTKVTGAPGWLTSYTGLAGAVPMLGAVAAASQAEIDWQNSTAVVTIPDPSHYTLPLKSDDAFLRAAYAGGTLSAPALQTLNVINAVNAAAATDTTDTTGLGAFGGVAQLINMNIGLRIVTVEFGGWDTHNDEQDRFTTNLTNLSAQLAAFWNAIPNHHNSVTLMTLTDFGRRVQSNANGGTDHGSGQVVTVLGNGVAGGRIYGDWLGLAANVLDAGDVPITTDLRSVMWEVVAPTLPGHSVASLFPGFSSTPIGIIKGAAASRALL
jgi:uncharacterized protein (DUF1501 family)